jgi:hypothetical protein
MNRRVRNRTHGGVRGRGPQDPLLLDCEAWEQGSPDGLTISIRTSGRHISETFLFLSQKELL